MDITIRQATIEDLNSITKVESICFPVAEAATKESFIQRINTFSKSFFVAEIYEKIIGFINGSIINETVIYDKLMTIVHYILLMEITKLFLGLM